MIKSMTGYGRASQTTEGMEITAEIRAVNHRFFDFSCKFPRQYGFLEEKVKSYVAGRVARGKVDVYITVSRLETPATSVEINAPLAKAYVDALRQLCVSYSLKDNITASDVAHYPDVLSIQKEQEDEQAITDAVLGTLSVAVDGFVKMREVEGERLLADLQSRSDTIIATVQRVEALSAQSVPTYRERLEAKMRELLGDTQIDEQRLITETAIFADKIAVDEETVRLRSHIAQLRELISGSDAVGRKLDFIVQEINREVNTIGSKANSLEITQLVVDMKSEIEKIREQIQNIE